MKSNKTKIVAVATGVALGVWRFNMGLHGIFTLSVSEGWVGLIAIAVTALMILPLSILGWFRPRAAAYLLFVDLVISLGFVLWLYVPAVRGHMNGWEWVVALGTVLFPQLLVGILLLLAAKD